MLVDPLLPPPQPPIEISAIQNATKPNARMLFLMTFIPLPLWFGEIPFAGQSPCKVGSTRICDFQHGLIPSTEPQEL